MRAGITTLVWLGAAACRGADGGAGNDTTLDPDAINTVDTDVVDAADTPADTDVVDTPVETIDIPVDTVDTVDTTPVADSDMDGVNDVVDQCPGEDDRVDINQDAVADCAQNLLNNGQITADITDWFDERIGNNLSLATFSAADALGNPMSGAIHVINQTAMTEANAAGVWSACVSAHPGDIFDVWYAYNVPPQGGAPQFITSFNTYADAHCQNAAASTTPGPPATTLGGWHVMHMGSPIALWPSWSSFEVRIELFKPGIAAPMEFELDNLLLLQVGP